MGLVVVEEFLGGVARRNNCSTARLLNLPRSRLRDWMGFGCTRPESVNRLSAVYRLAGDSLEVSGCLGRLWIFGCRNPKVLQEQFQESLWCRSVGISSHNLRRHLRQLLRVSSLAAYCWNLMSCLSLTNCYSSWKGCLSLTNSCWNLTSCWGWMSCYSSWKDCLNSTSCWGWMSCCSSLTGYHLNSTSC